ncbi:hypothetical protein ACFE04_010170 [Oxalis oulophora]
MAEKKPTEKKSTREKKSPVAEKASTEKKLKVGKKLPNEAGVAGGEKEKKKRTKKSVKTHRLDSITVVSVLELSLLDDGALTFSDLSGKALTFTFDEDDLYKDNNNNYDACLPPLLKRLLKDFDGGDDYDDDEDASLPPLLKCLSK